MKSTFAFHFILPASMVIIAILAGCSKKNGPPPPKTPSYGLTTTFAGNGTAGAGDSTGTTASFYGPSGVCVDAAGNIYVADSGNNLIREISPAGVVTTFAGNGNKGALNGPALEAEFNDPYAITMDGAGNFYVSDSGNNMVRKISGGTVSTLAGNGAIGATNGAGATASFNNPLGLVIDAGGNVYLCDGGNNLIRKITAAGEVSNLAGAGIPGSANGTGISARFNSPQGLILDASGNLLVADEANQLIRKVSPDGEVTTFAGTGTANSMDGSLTTASFDEPNGLAFDAAGNLYVTDGGSSEVRKITPAGAVITLAGTGTAGFTNGIGTGAAFSGPSVIVVDKNYNAYVADFGNDVIRKIVVKE